mmetsp:Transcript_19355/g.53144  ORF Transcript_19355/g.53144 Transcript_19355/m.53144 type:complete len:420 (-) Transcript_19355:193-1452(-)
MPQKGHAVSIAPRSQTTALVATGAACSTLARASTTAPGGKVGAVAESTSEMRLFDLVRMIRDWVERSFSPQQEARLQQKGRLCARFQVDLGKEMTAQLRAYIAASFMLRLIKFRVVAKEQPQPRRGAAADPPECVEVILSPEARALYAEKCPDAVARHAGQPEASNACIPGGLLVDADGDGHEERDRLSPCEAIADGQQALPCNVTAGGQRALPCGQQDQSLALVPSAAAGAAANAADAVASKAQSLQQGLEQAFGKRAAAKFLAGADNNAAKSGQVKRKADAMLPQAADSDEKAVCPAAAPAAVSGTGSVWEQCRARAVPPGNNGLVEARDALDEGLARSRRGGLDALKAEKEVVSWLKGLLEREVTVAELRDSKIGVTVNSWRKHNEPFISGLAVSLLTAWKRAWREAEKSERRSIG